MEQREQNNIRIAVEDEKELYTSLNPEPEFSTTVKKYLKEKMERIYGLDYSHGITLTVLSQEPVNEEKFTTAAANWITEEKELFRKTEKENLRLLIALLAVGSVLIVLSLALVKRFEVLQHSLLPIMGSLALSKATGMLLIDIPLNRAQRQIMNQMEKNNVIVFEYTDPPT